MGSHCGTSQQITTQAWRTTAESCPSGWISYCQRSAQLEIIKKVRSACQAMFGQDQLHQDPTDHLQHHHPEHHHPSDHHHHQVSHPEQCHHQDQHCFLQLHSSRTCLASYCRECSRLQLTCLLHCLNYH